MAEQKVNGKVVEIRKMSVAGAVLSLAEGFKYFVNLRLNYANVSEEELLGLASEGSSVRVKAQAKLRADEGTLREKGIVAESAADVKADELGWIEYDVATDFERSSGGTANPEKRAKSAYAKMTVEQRIAFIMDTLNVPEDVAKGMVG